VGCQVASAATKCLRTDKQAKADEVGARCWIYRGGDGEKVYLTQRLSLHCARCGGGTRNSKPDLAAKPAGSIDLSRLSPFRSVRQTRRQRRRRRSACLAKLVESKSAGCGTWLTPSRVRALLPAAGQECIAPSPTRAPVAVGQSARADAARLSRM
jgi:hypothetical protein